MNRRVYKLVREEKKNLTNIIGKRAICFGAVGKVKLAHKNTKLGRGREAPEEIN